MREILFRGKRLDNGEWIYGFVIHSQKDNSWAITNEFEYLHDVDGNTIGQYTGLTDKNNVKIFEWDIVRVVYNGKENIFVVIWDSSELDFKATNGKENYGVGGFQYLGCCDEIEIIGNVFGNPELLNESFSSM